jgi:hypothetical protein
MDDPAPQAAHGNAGGETPSAETEVTELLAGITVAMLRETFDNWTIGEVDGCLWAFRAGTFTGEGPRSLLRPCVTAGSAPGLADQLCLQARLESLSAAELEAVWRHGLTAVEA